MAAEMKGIMSQEVSSLLGELTEIGQTPIKEYEDLQTMANKTRAFVEKKLEAMLQLSHADQQVLAPALKARSTWLDDARTRFIFCWKAQVSPESYFKDPKGLKYLKAEEQAKLEVLERVHNDWTLTDEESLLFAEINKKITSQIEAQINNLNMLGEPVSNACATLGAAVARLTAKMQGNAPKPLPKPSQWQWPCTVL